MSSIDTSLTRTFRQKPGKMALLLLGCLAFIVIGVITGRHLEQSGDSRAWEAYLSVAVFALLAVGVVWRTITQRGTVVTLSPDGISDRRLASKMIPWQVIEDVFTWTERGQRVMVLQVAPEVESGLGLTRIAKMTRKANAALGADGLCITATGLDVRYDDLLAMTIAYLVDARERQGRRLPQAPAASPRT